MNALVSGAGGMLGHASAVAIPYVFPNLQLTITTRSTFDITSKYHVEKVLSATKPDLLINCAAYTKVDLAEAEKQKAFTANATGPEILAKACAKYRVKLVHISTDYVFDGAKAGPYTEGDQVNPVGVYGASKLEGEKRILDALPQALIVRTSWLYGPGGQNFVKTILAKAKERRELSVVDDQTGSPTYTRELAYAIANLISVNASGIVHITNQGSCTWYEFAAQILRLAGMGYVTLKPVASSEYPTAAKRPKNSTLDNSKYNSLTGKPMRHWSQALADYIPTAKLGV